MSASWCACALPPGWASKRSPRCWAKNLRRSKWRCTACWSAWRNNWRPAMSEPMKIHPEYQPSIELEKKIESFYETITPDPAFERELGLQIARRSKQLSARRPGLLDWL